MSALREWRHIIPSPEQVALCEEAIVRVASFLLLSPEAIRAHDRRPHVTLGRHLVFAVLADAGLNPAEIARVLELNHSTVLHGLEQMQRRPERRAVYEALKDALPATLRPRGACSLAEAIRLACADRAELSPADAANVTAYITGDVLGHRAPPWEALMRYHGRRLLRERPDLDAEVGRILALFAGIAPTPRPVQVPPARVSYPLRGLEVSR